MAAPQISLTEFPQWELLHWHFGLDAYTYTYASAITATAGDREATDQNNAVPSEKDLEEQSEFPLWELETGEISNQGFYKCLKIKSDTLLMPSQMTQTKARKFPRWEFDESYHSTVPQILHKLKEQCKVRK